MEGARATTDINSAEAALSGGLFFFAGSDGLQRVIFGENFSRTVKLADGEPRRCCYVFSNSTPSLRKWIASANEFGIRVPAVRRCVP